MRATIKGYFEIIQDLISNGGNANAADNVDYQFLENDKLSVTIYVYFILVFQFGLSALIYAACGGHIDIIHYLISNGADIDGKDKLINIATLY